MSKKFVKNFHHKTRSDIVKSLSFFFFFFFFSINSPKPKNSAFTVTNDKEKQQILTHKKLEPVSIDYLTNKLID